MANDSKYLDITNRIEPADIVIYGSSHELSIKQSERFNTLFVNPGSITGAFHPSQTKPCIPSFILLDVQSRDLVNVFTYQLIENEVKVEKKEFKV
jgi:predicted phosphodiesterase